MLYGALTWLAVSAYGGMVCPFVDGIGYVGASALMAPGVLLALLVRPFAVRFWISGLEVAAQGAAQLRLDVALAAMAGAVELGLAMIGLDFPAESGVKIIFGFATFGAFFGVDLALRRARALIVAAPRGGLVVPHVSLAADFSVAAVMLLGLGGIDLMMVLGNDLAWLESLDPEAQSAAHGVVLTEIALVMGTLLCLSVLVVRSWAQTLAARLDAHHVVLEAVEEGRLDQRLPLDAHDELGLLAARTNRMIDGLAEREQLRAVLGKVTHPAAARRLLAGAAGERINVAVLVCDLRGFTSLSEHRDPEVVVELLNRWFAAAVPLVHAQGGAVDKFLGDGMLAVFGLDTPAAAADRALAAAQALVQAAEALAAATGLPLRLGAAVHFGPVVAGTIGATDRMEFTVIGDTVNTAARLEGLTKTLGEPVLLSAPAADALVSRSAHLRDLGAHQLRGRAQAVSVFAPADARSADDGLPH